MGLLLGAVLALTGCIYENPIAQPSQKISTDALGFWNMKAIDPEDGEENDDINLGIYRFSDTEYLMVMSDDSGEDAFFRGYPVSVGGKTYMQVQWIETEDPQNPDEEMGDSYFVFDMTVKGDSMTIAMMASMETEASSDALKQIILDTPYDELFVPIYEATRTSGFSNSSSSSSNNSGGSSATTGSTGDIVGYWGVMQDDVVILRWFDDEDDICMTLFGKKGDDLVVFSEWSVDGDGVLELSDVYTATPTIDGGTRNEEVLDTPVVKYYQTSINSDGDLVMELITGDGVPGTPGLRTAERSRLRRSARDLYR